MSCLLCSTCGVWGAHGLPHQPLAQRLARRHPPEEAILTLLGEEPCIWMASHSCTLSYL